VIGNGEFSVTRQAVKVNYNCGVGAPAGCPSPPRGYCTRRVPTPGIFEGYAERLLSIVDPLLRANSQRYTTAISEGIASRLREVVLPANQPAADVTPMLAALRPGKYTLRVVRLDDPNASQTLQVSWGQQSAPMISTSSPGLYRVMLLGTSGEYTGVDAWALVVNQESFASTRQLFARAVEATDSWPRQVTDDSKCRVRRAYLEALWQKKVPNQ
jgi:hypothetical protein